MPALALLLATALLAAHPSSGGHERALRLLREAAVAPAVDPELLRRELASAGGEGVPVLFAALDLRVLPADDVEARLLPLPPPVLGAVWAAFADSDTAAVRAHLARLAKSDYPEHTRATAVRLLGGVGDTQDLALIGALAMAGAAGPGDEMRAAFREGLARLFERKPASARWSHELFAAVPGTLWVPFLDAVSALPAHERLGVLAGLLRRVPDADIHVLREITALGRRGRGTHDEYVRGNVRDYLMAVDEALQRSAIEAAGALGDEDSVPQLIRLCESRSAGVVSSARWALLQITGNDFGTSAQRWQAWYDGEVRFWREESHAWLAGLRALDPAQVAASLTKLAHHGLYRSEIAAAVVPVLERAEPALRRMACSVLGTLGCPRVRDDLEQVLFDTDPAVAEAARAALLKLSVRVLRPPH